MPPLFRKREVWWPTWLGFVCLIVIFGGLVSLWWLEGEAFLSATSREPADVLVVEGWISDQGIRAAADEFKAGHYRFIVATGGFSGEAWLEHRRNYAEDAEQTLLRIGLSPNQVIRAATSTTETQRTFQMATTARAALNARGIHPKAVNVFTRGSHARRSRLIFSKAFAPDVRVGIVSWIPSGYETERWWHSSERSEDMLKETVGYAFELFFNSGRGLHSLEATPRESKQN